MKTRTTKTVAAVGMTRDEIYDAYTREVTAFRSWVEFKAAMAGGYCPTLRGDGDTGRLAEMLIEDGYPIFRDGKVIRTRG